MKDLTNKEIVSTNGGCLSFDLGFAIQYLGNMMLPGGGNTTGLGAAYPYGDAQHEH